MIRASLSLASLLVLSACAYKPDSPGSVRAALAGLKERAGLVLAEDPFGDGANKLVYLDQGWNVPETLWYYHADQGSALLPYEVLVHLEQPDSDKRMIDPQTGNHNGGHEYGTALSEEDRWALVEYVKTL